MYGRCQHQAETPGPIVAGSLKQRQAASIGRSVPAKGLKHLRERIGGISAVMMKHPGLIIGEILE